MNKVKEFIKKHWFILLIVLLSLLRFLFTYKLPNFYLDLMNYDDMLKVAEKLSENFPHVRVDLYNDNGL